MKLPCHPRLFVLTVALACASVCGAQAPGLKVVLPANTSAYPLAPGLYLYAQGRGPFSVYPGAGALRVTKSSGSRFVSGSLELLRIGLDGHLLDLKSEVSGVAEGPSCAPPALYCIRRKSNTITTITFSYGSPTTDLDILDKPLSTMLGKVTSHMLSQGIRISWTGSASAIGQDRTGDYAVFVPGTESEYGEILREYEAMASFKQRDVQVKKVSAAFIRAKIGDFMDRSEVWIHELPDSSLQSLATKAKELYLQERGSIANSDMDKARLAMMQINAIELEAHFIRRSQVDKDAFIRNLDASVSGAYTASPCFGEESAFGPDRKPLPGSPQACNSVPPLVIAYKVRVKKLYARMNEERQTEQQVSLSLKCIVEDANHLIGPAWKRVDDACKPSLSVK